MKLELHLFILWEKARCLERKILDDLNRRFKIINVFEITWSPESFSSNLSRFYGQNLPPGSQKEKHCGRGPFRLVSVQDKIPVYEKRKTSKGIYQVNKNTFDTKGLYRNWTGGGHKIHGTNSPRETSHDLALLFSCDSLIFDRPATGQWDGKIFRLKQDLVGAVQWESLDQLFFILNLTTNYVVLRNFEGLPFQLNQEVHGDIDLLTENYQEMCLITNAQQVFHQKYRVHHKVKVAGEEVFFDFRYVGDGYYDTNWERAILTSKVFSPDGLFIPCQEDYFYSLLYHAAVHKPFFPKDYRGRLLKLADKLNINKFNITTLTDEFVVKKILDNYLSQRGYRYVEPVDLSVFFNQKIAGIVKISLKRKIFTKFRAVLSQIKRILFSEKISSIKWSLKDARRFYKVMEQEHGLIKLKPYKFWTWRQGCKYFLGYHLDSAKQVFIKTGGRFTFPGHEAQAIKVIAAANGQPPDNFPHLITYQAEGLYPFVALEFIPRETLQELLAKAIKDPELKRVLLEQMNKILTLLHQAEIVHRDIRPDNFIVYWLNHEDFRLILIDFAFSVGLKPDNGLPDRLKQLNEWKLLKELGDGFNPQPFVWDDAYSFCQIAKMIDEDCEYNYPEQWQELASKVGKTVKRIL